jgi:hypothetical protein
MHPVARSRRSVRSAARATIPRLLEPRALAMIHHVVLLRIKPRTSKAVLDKTFAAIGAMKKHVKGLKSFEWGPYSSTEGLNKGFNYGFVMTFTTAKERDNYLVHPEHEKVKAAVLKLLDGGLDGVIAFDF